VHDEALDVRARRVDGEALGARLERRGQVVRGREPGGQPLAGALPLAPGEVQVEVQRVQAQSNDSGIASVFRVPVRPISQEELLRKLREGAPRVLPRPE